MTESILDLTVMYYALLYTGFGHCCLILNLWKCTVYSWRFVCYKFFHLHSTKSYWGVELYFCSFLTSSLNGGQLVSRSGRFTSFVGSFGTNLTQRWAVPRTSLDTWEEECVSLDGYRSTIPHM